jgi:DnaJ-class molecular chaperone
MKGLLTYILLMSFIGTNLIKVPKGTYQGGEPMNPSKTATANRHAQQSTAADELLVSAFRSLRGLFQRGTSSIGRKIFRSSDYQAHQHGWQITPRHGGLSRTYRDTRFDYLAACTRCNGRGHDPRSITCADCQGTGRVSLALGVISSQHREQS